MNIMLFKLGSSSCALDWFSSHGNAMLLAGVRARILGYAAASSMLRGSPRSQGGGLRSLWRLR